MNTGLVWYLILTVNSKPTNIKNVVLELLEDEAIIRKGKIEDFITKSTGIRFVKEGVNFVMDVNYRKNLPIYRKLDH